MNNPTERKYRFTYGYAHPDQHPECPDFEGDYYVELSDADVIENGETATEAGFLVVAMDRFLDERETVEHNETEEYELRRIEVVPITKASEGHSVKLQKLMDEYTSEADSMSDLILSWLDEDKTHVLSDEEIQALIEFAGDEEYVTVEDIRNMAANDPIYNCQPYSAMKTLLDWFKGFRSLGNDRFEKTIEAVDARIEIDRHSLEAANSIGEIERSHRRVNDLMKYRRMLKVFEAFDRVETDPKMAEHIRNMLNSDTFDNALKCTCAMLDIAIRMVEKREPFEDEMPPGMYGSDKIKGKLYRGETVQFDGKDWIVANEHDKTYTLMLKTMTETTAFDHYDYHDVMMGSYLPPKQYDISTIADKCITFQNAMSSKALSVVNEAKVQGVSTQVWIATHEDIKNWTNRLDETDFSWSSIRRWQSTDKTVDPLNAAAYWCSDLSGSSVWIVRRDGVIARENDSNLPYGFRPCIEVTQEEEYEDQ